MSLLQKVSYRGCEFDLFDLTAINPIGNKFFKLRNNLQLAVKQGHQQILTFGGAWSNHVHALAQIGPQQGFKTIAVIRGEQPVALNPSLQEAQAAGMQLHFVSRATYKQRESLEYLAELEQSFGKFYLLPEGGTNSAGVEGCREIVDILQKTQPEYDEVFVALGSGGTMAGIAKELPKGKSVTGVCVLKGAVGINDSVSALIPDVHNWHIDHEGHCGGYAKCPEDLKTFILDFEAHTGIDLEPVYTGKMIYRLIRLLESSQRLANRRVVAIHTGGLQGRRGYDF